MAGQSAPDIAISDAGCKDNVCWALSNAKPGSAAKLQAEQLKEQVSLLDPNPNPNPNPYPNPSPSHNQVSLLEQRLEIDQAKLQNRPAVAAAPKPAPAAVAAPEPPAAVVTAPEP